MTLRYLLFVESYPSLKAALFGQRVQFSSASGMFLFLTLVAGCT